MAKKALSENQKISSRAELERLWADRENDAEHLKLDHPRPSWALSDPEHPRRIHMRMRERRISFLEERLGIERGQAHSEFEKSSRAHANQNQEASHEPEQ